MPCVYFSAGGTCCVLGLYFIRPISPPASLMDYPEIVIYLHNCVDLMCVPCSFCARSVRIAPGQKHRVHILASVVHIFAAQKSSATRNILFLLFCFSLDWNGVLNQSKADRVWPLISFQWKTCDSLAGSFYPSVARGASFIWQGRQSCLQVIKG